MLNLRALFKYTISEHVVANWFFNLHKIGCAKGVNLTKKCVN